MKKHLVPAAALVIGMAICCSCRKSMTEPLSANANVSSSAPGIMPVPVSNYYWFLQTTPKDNSKSPPWDALSVYGSPSFVAGSKAYIAAFNHLWEYDASTGGWANDGLLPGCPSCATVTGSSQSGGRLWGIAFAVGGKGYFGTGLAAGIRVKDFWEFNTATKLWTQKADFPGGNRNGAVGFSIGGKGYAGAGIGNDSHLHNDFWEYDPANDHWTAKANITTTRSGATGLGTATKGYVGLGVNYIYPLGGDPIIVSLKDFWEYDPPTNHWTKKADYPGIGRYAATGFVLNDSPVIGTGTYTDPSHVQKDCYQYSTTGNTWTKIADYSGGATSDATGFAIGNYGYILRQAGQFGQQYPSLYNIFYKYAYSTIPPVQPIH